MSKADDAKSLVQQGLDKALVAQQSLARKNVERLRRVHPGDTPQELIRRLDRSYLARVTASGGVSGAAGIVPGAGIPTALADTMAFTEASVHYLLSLAEVHGVHPEDFERRRHLVSTVFLGGGAVRSWDKVVEHTGPYWGRRIVRAIPMSAIDGANKVLRPHFITKYGTKQGVLVLSKQVPLGIGAVLGAGGNHVFGRLTIKSARTIFGPPPSSWADDGPADKVPFAPDSGDSILPDVGVRMDEPDDSKLRLRHSAARRCHASPAFVTNIGGQRRLKRHRFNDNCPWPVRHQT